MSNGYAKLKCLIIRLLDFIDDRILNHPSHRLCNYIGGHKFWDACEQVAPGKYVKDWIDDDGTIDRANMKYRPAQTFEELEELLWEKPDDDDEPGA